MFDYHCHTEFSSDCTTPMEEMVKTAIAKGLKEICFTDHVDYDYKDDSIVFEIDEEKYLESVHYLQEKYKDQIKVIKGLEIGIQPQILDKCRALVDRIKPDFVIASMHTCNELDLYSGAYYKGKTGQQSYENYLKEMYHIVENFDDFCVLGHLDVIKRYDDQARAYDIKEVMHLIDEVLKLLIKKGKGIEINSSGLRSELKEPLPKWCIIERYRELGGEIITFGSDSHNTNDICHDYDVVIERLKDIGFTAISTFDGMDVVFHEI